MAGIVILGVATLIEAVHGEIADRRSPLICLNADANVLSTSPTSTSSSSSGLATRFPSFRRTASVSLSEGLTANENERAPLHRSVTGASASIGGGGAGGGGRAQQVAVTISKRGLKKLTTDWDLRAGEIAWRIREIERHHRAAGALKCWAGAVKDLGKLKDALTEAREIRYRLVEALLYLRALPDPLKKASLNPLHRRPKDVLPVHQLPPSLNGLPVPLPKPPKSGDWRLVLDKTLPGYEEARSSPSVAIDSAMVESVMREVREGRDDEDEDDLGGLPPSYDDVGRSSA